MTAEIEAENNDVARLVLDLHLHHCDARILVEVQVHIENEQVHTCVSRCQESAPTQPSSA